MFLVFLFTIVLAYTNAVEEQIVAGLPAGHCELPSIVHMLFDTHDATYACGGTLISNRLILTAAHCFAEGTRQIRVRVGNIDVENPAVMTVHADGWTVHPQYTSDPMRNDIALVHLEFPLTLTDCIQTAPLPLPGKVYDNKRCIAAGWGAVKAGMPGPKTLHKVSMPVINHEVCKKKMSYASLEKQHICGGDFVRGGASTCMGDSGGPLYCPDNGKMVVAGITSFGYDCSIDAAIFTNVAYFRRWIENSKALFN
ncbi:vitamin K-dependent protein C-like [Argonauta hians]